MSCRSPWAVPITVDEWMGGGELPTILLQEAWCADPCPASDPRWYDLLFTLTYTSHFMVGLTLAMSDNQAVGGGDDLARDRGTIDVYIHWREENADQLAGFVRQLDQPGEELRGGLLDAPRARRGDEVIGLFFGGISGPQHPAVAVAAAIDLAERLRDAGVGVERVGDDRDGMAGSGSRCTRPVRHIGQPDLG